MQKNLKGRLDTTTKSLSTLCEEIRKGEVKIPQFQRKFVWKDQQALDLLDSMANNYPVGSLLIWTTKDKMRVERNIGDFSLPDTDDVDPTDYVLDGQQRLTVIYSCLGAEPTDPGFAAGYDLEKEEFVRLPKNPLVHVFPLRHLYVFTAMLNFRAALLTHPRGKELNERFDAIAGILTNYRIPVVTLKDLTVDEVCPIFERVNSSGTKLSTFDLMAAATWTRSFDLNEQVEQIQGALVPKGFDDIEGGTVLKCLSAIQCRGVKRAQIFSLDKLPKSDMTELVSRAQAAVLKSVDLLSTEFRVYSWDFLPYEALAVVLTYVTAKQPNLSPDQVVRVRQWFWRSALNERYRGASDSVVSSDLDLIHDFVVNRKGSPDEFGGVPKDEAWERGVFRSNNSRSRAFVLALALLNPKNVTNGAAIDISEALSAFNQKEFHHVYPRAHLRSIDAPGEHNANANICILSASENKRVGSADPKSYLPRCALALGAHADSVFASNLLPSPASFDYSTATYSDFVQARLGLIGNMLSKLCNGEV
ncbi:DUF262 domain-containing protein [Paludisphaera rhizosphaerae]|uniref:DUF262 domain-containing protein n=1 Tax=Paludisphaera rhizosphaerae TaxID=2711216 RepID=UPI0013EA33B2|nr:DUF262 domain-containing protein [Paludisphaera rhizosphaerae]